MAMPTEPAPNADMLAGMEGLIASLKDRKPREAGFQRAVGRYAVLGEIGRGGMGTVFKAYDESLDRSIAIKVLKAETSERHALRLRREAQALAKLSHPNVVHVYEVGETDGQWFIAMELVRGQTLRKWQRGGRAWRECVQVYRQAGAGLAAAHAAGLVHRDFKPDNCIIDEQGRPKVLDFGLVRVSQVTSEDDVSLEAQMPDAESPGASLTRTGTVLGTLAYMPLEQLNGRPADARSDQFSFCVALYEALYGERPFFGQTVGELMVALMTGRIQPPPKGAAVPSTLRRVLLRGLSSDPENRWPTMDALLVELGRVAMPKRIGLTLLAMGGGLAALVVPRLGAEQTVEAPPPCQGSETHLEGIWDDARNEELKAAVLGTGLSYASDTWDRIGPALDEYAAAWAAKHTEVCEATSVRKEQSPEVMDLRMACLQRRRTNLRQTVEVLMEAKPRTMEKAVDLVADLPRLAQCDDIEALQEELPPPDKPWVAEQVEMERERVALAWLLLESGDFDRGSLEAEAVVEQAEALGYPPLLSEAWQLRGVLRRQKGHYAEAEQDLEKAYLLAVELGHSRTEASTVSELAFVVGTAQARHDAGLQWAKIALALSKRSNDPVLEAIAFSSVGAILILQYKLDDALDYYRRALAIQEEMLGPKHWDVANSRYTIGAILMRQGRLDDALTHFQQALVANEDALGPRHPRYASILDGIGALLKEQGRLDDALGHHQRALVIQEEALGADHPGNTVTLTNIGVVLTAQERFDEALRYHQRALVIKEEALGERHPNVAITLSNIGLVLTELDRAGEARVHLRRALDIWTTALGSRHPFVAFALNNIGSALEQEGKLSEALESFRQALSIREEAMGSRHSLVAYSLNSIGNVLHKQGKLDEAFEHHQRALDIRKEALGPKHPDVAESHIGLAKVGLAKQDIELARTHAGHAVANLEAAEGAPSRLAEARFLLARALWPDPGQRRHARALAEQARDSYTMSGNGGADELADVESWLDAHVVAALQ